MLPLPALLAFDTPRLALSLLAVEPRLRGIAFSAPVGSGKSALLKGFSTLVPDVHSIDLPLSSDTEALLGGLDVEATLRIGKKIFRDGLLAQSNGSALIAEACNLLPDQTVNLLLGALDEGCVRIERDGISRRLDTRFCLLTSFDPAEGVPRAHLLDRLGMIVTLPVVSAHDARAEILRRHLSPNDEEWGEELELMRSVIHSARQLVPEVTVSSRIASQLIEVAMAMGVEGHRADHFARLVARASAALGLRTEVTEEDADLAIRLVLMPRATQLPQTAPPPQAPADEPPPLSGDDKSQEPQSTRNEDTPPEPVDEVLDAITMELPAVLESLPFAHQRSGRAGSRGAIEGSRGRHIGSIPGSIRNRRLDVIATLRAASRWQRLRPKGRSRVCVKVDDFRVKRFRSKAGSLFVFAVDASGSMALNRMRQAKGAVHALLAQAYVHRDKVALVSFRSDAATMLLPPSNSVELLRRAVDQIPTGGATPIAATLLKTLEIAEQSRRKGFKNVCLVMLTDGRANVGLQGDRTLIESELKALGRRLGESGVRSLVIDTQRSFISHGPGKSLADWMDGQYLYLPNASAEQLAHAVKGYRANTDR